MPRKETPEQRKERMAKVRAAKGKKVVGAEVAPPKDGALTGPVEKPRAYPMSKQVEPEVPIGDTDEGDLFEDAPEDVEVELEAVPSVFPLPAPKEEVLPAIPDDGINLAAELTADEKKQFIELIDKNMPAAERAERLCELARLRGTKTAAVGLRALQEIHSLKRLHGEQSSESAPLFVLPADTKVGIIVQKVSK